MRPAAPASPPPPNLLDKVVTFFSPAAGLERHRARCLLAVTGGYAGGGGFTGAKSDRKALRNYNPRAGSGTSDINPDLVPLRSRTRDLSRNNPIGAAAIDTMVRHSIGTGLWPQARLDWEALGITEEQATVWERAVERIWTAWAESRACDVTGRHTFAQLQALIFRSILDSGDAGVLRRYKRRKWSTFGTCVHVIEADRICNPNDTADETRIAGGVESDEDGEPIAYHVLKHHPGDVMWGTTGVREWARVPARGDATGMEQMLLPFPITRPDQRRGVALLAPVIETVKQLGRFVDAEVDAAVVSAFFTAFITQPPPLDEEVDDELSGTPAAPPSTSPLAAAEDVARELEMGPGAVVGLLPGEDVKMAAPTRPNPAADAFIWAVCQLIGAALGIPAEVLFKRFTASYSASRGALLDAAKTFGGARFWFADLVCRPIREWVLWEAVASGALNAPGFLTDPTRRQLWLACDWVGDAPGELDPARAALAAKLRMDSFLSTLREETLAGTGMDWERNLEQAAREKRRRKELELVVDADKTAAEIAELLAREDSQP